MWIFIILVVCGLAAWFVIKQLNKKKCNQVSSLTSTPNETAVPETQPNETVVPETQPSASKPRAVTATQVSIDSEYGPYTSVMMEYYGDGLNSKTMYGGTRDGLKHRQVSVPKKVQEYGNKYGYSKLSFSFYGDHLVIYGGGSCLMDKDFNGAASDEFITSIVSIKWMK